jgi:hypothetical protein
MFQGQLVTLSGTGLPPKPFYISEVCDNKGVVLVCSGSQFGSSSFTDVSLYTTASNAIVSADRQAKNVTTRDRQGVVWNAFETQPTVALRTVQVDQFGQYGIGTKTAQFQYVRLSSSDITTFNSASNPVTLFTASGTIRQLWLLSSLNSDVSFTVDGNEAFRFEGATNISSDFGSDGLHIPAGAVVKVYHNGTAPTSGSVRGTGIY